MSNPNSNATIEKKSDTEWVWRMEEKYFSVRAFPSTRRLIYSSYITSSSGGAMFDDGIAQTYDSFLAGDVPPHALPESVAQDLRAYLTGKSPAKKPKGETGSSGFGGK